MSDSPADALQRVPSYIERERYEEAERLLIGVLREAEEGSALHWDGVLTLAELYETQERFVEAQILTRGVAQKLDSQSELGQRAQRLTERLQTTR